MQLSLLPSTEAAPDRRSLRQLIHQMNRAFRDSEGGGIVERFEAVSKLLFTKIMDERELESHWDGRPSKSSPEFRWCPGDTEGTVYQRVLSIWRRTTAGHEGIADGERGSFPKDVRAVARVATLLGNIDLRSVGSDVKGDVYEDILRNTFEKNENQQFFTPRQIVDLIVDLCCPSLDDDICDPACGSGGFLVATLSRLLRGDAATSRRTQSIRGADVDERMAWVARMNMLMHGGEPSAICHLPSAGSLGPQASTTCLPPQSFDLILTNPPFGSDLTDREVLAGYETGRGRLSRRRSILFVECCLRLLRPGGRLAIVLDDSVLNLPTNDDVRRLIRKRAVIEAVISLPEVAFMPYSTAKCSILIARSRLSQAETTGPVFMAEVDEVGIRPNGDPLYADEYGEGGQPRLKTDLPAVLQSYRSFRDCGSLGSQPASPVVFAADIEAHLSEPDGTRLDVNFYHPARSAAQAQLGHSRYPLARLGELVQIDNSGVNPASEFGDLAVRWIGLGDIESVTGRYEVRQMPGDRIKSSAHGFKSGDILFSRLRPKLRKTVFIPAGDEGGICSSELLVLRLAPQRATAILPEFLAYLLRSDLAYGQLVYQVTGIGRPRVSVDAVKHVMLPLPPICDQTELLGRLHRAHAEAAYLRAQAHQNHQDAHQKIERAYDELIGHMFEQPPSQYAPGMSHPLESRPTPW